jgi:hypothetical protein
MATFSVKWKVIESDGMQVRDQVVASGAVTKEASSAAAIHNQLEPLLRSAFPELTAFTTREYIIDVQEVGSQPPPSPAKEDSSKNLPAPPNPRIRTRHGWTTSEELLASYDRRSRTRVLRRWNRLKADLANAKARYRGEDSVWNETVMPMWREGVKYRAVPYGDEQGKEALFKACRLVLSQDREDPVATEIMCRRVWNRLPEYDPRNYPAKITLWKFAVIDYKRRRECAKTL